MPRLPAALSVLALACSIFFTPVACTTPVVPSTVIATAQSVAATAATVVADAQIVWPTVLASIPAASQAAAQTAFNQAVFAVNHADLALDDAIQAAIAANTTNPDFTAAFSALSAAVAQVLTIIQSFETVPVTPNLRTADGGVDVLADLTAAAASLKKLAAPKSAAPW
jgi:hypothetical protein